MYRHVLYILHNIYKHFPVFVTLFWDETGFCRLDLTCRHFGRYCCLSTNLHASSYWSFL